ncbi:ROK family protein [Arthrobacter castelli]|uniref:ROK family protein n=1 Tax=Arthrobacter castelli TaxID=271431 RepID=UPI001FDEE1E2|nr:ROK family protein [Arthrobacter castelli]
MIASKQASSRSELASALGMAGSSISVSVQALLELGWIKEVGSGTSTGGRKPRILTLGGEAHYVLCADVGIHHVRVGAVTLDGSVETAVTYDFDITLGPEHALEQLEKILRELVDERNPRQLLGIGLTLPGPVNTAEGTVDSPSRMPGWHRYSVRAELDRRFMVPTCIANDANAMALGEHSAQPMDHKDSITIKAGTALGAGVIIDGNIHEGATGAAGDMTHVRVADADDIPCSCGNRGCLETIASGAAIVRMLSEQRADVGSILDVVDLVRAGDALATSLVRDAGRHLGEVLSAVVNFFNPSAVYLGGVMSTLEPYVAAFRSRLYEGCHPLATKHLIIQESQLGQDAGIAGVGRLTLDLAFASPIVHQARKEA